MPQHEVWVVIRTDEECAARPVFSFYRHYGWLTHQIGYGQGKGVKALGPDVLRALPAFTPLP